jgi:hypothetical protein
MRLNNHQKKMVCDATEIVHRIINNGGNLDCITQEEAGLLLSVMAIIEEHEQPDEGQELIDLIDRNFGDDDDDD